MELDEPSAQLYSDLGQSIQSALTSRRPILHHLNADTSWFLQIPRPESAIRNGSRFYYNILIDPWLSGGQSDVASWFSQQFHSIPSAVQSIAELEELAAESENVAVGPRSGTQRKTSGLTAEDNGQVETFIDAIAISHEFTDHCHKETLLEVHRNTPVFAIREAAKLIDGWKHFRTVITVHAFGAGGDTDWRSSSSPPLPDWIGISRLLQTDDVLNYHSALMITFNNRHAPPPVQPLGSPGGTNNKRKPHRDPAPDADNDDAAEALVYTPHGIHAADLQIIPAAAPPIRTLAFLHGLHNVRVGTAGGRTALQSNLGAHNGLQAQRSLNAKYWIGTHDEIKKGGGLVAWFLHRDVISLEDALEHERAAMRQQSGRVDVDADAQLEDVVDSFADTNWMDLANGESRVLV